MKAISIGEGKRCTEPGLADARARLLSTMVERVGAELSDRAPCVLTKVWRSVGADAASRVRAASTCPVDRSPVCVCGHVASSHRLDFIDGDVCESWCDCHRFRYPSLPSVAACGWSACADLCNCGGEHVAGRIYFVSARVRSRRNNRPTTLTALLLGPFATHGEALGAVRRGEDLAGARDARSALASFGTCSLPGDTTEIGILDERYVAPVDAPRGEA